MSENKKTDVVEQPVKTEKEIQFEEQTRRIQRGLKSAAFALRTRAAETRHRDFEEEANLVITTYLKAFNS